MNAKMEIVRLTADVVTTSTGGAAPTCECNTIGIVSANATLDDC